MLWFICSDFNIHLIYIADTGEYGILDIGCVDWYDTNGNYWYRDYDITITEGDCSSITPSPTTQNEMLFDNLCDCNISTIQSSAIWTESSYSDTTNPLGPWYGLWIDFKGTQDGGDQVVFDYQIECNIPCKIIDFTIEGYALVPF